LEAAEASLAARETDAAGPSTASPRRASLFAGEAELDRQVERSTSWSARPQGASAAERAVLAAVADAGSPGSNEPPDALEARLDRRRRAAKAAGRRQSPGSVECEELSAENARLSGRRPRSAPPSTLGRAIAT
jgi:hypothetical protein